MISSSQKGSANPFGKLSYLIIDDFESFRLSMRQMLRSCGADKIELVGHAAPAIQYCTYNHVDVVLCDYNLGEGKNGQHVLEELRHKKLLRRSSLFLMVTAETSKEMVMGAREYQPDGYLTKPINRAMLEKRLGSLIEQRNALLPINREIDRENYPEAISLCLQMLPKQPRYKTWLMKTLGDLYFQLGDLTHAIKVYDDVLAQRELSWARLGKCKVLLANRNYDDAVQGLQQLIESHPDYMEAYDLMAEGLKRQGRLPQAQQALQKAIEHSPNALLRQKHLAELAASNQDMNTSADAWRRTVALGTYSIHDSSEHYLALSQTLSDLSEGNTEADGVDQANEALSILGKMEKRFSDEDGIGTRSRIIQCRVHAGQGRQQEAEKILTAVRKEFEEAGASSAEAGLDYAKTLFRLNHPGDAKKLLADLAQRFSDNPDVLSKIEALLDEPVGFRQKLQARAFTRQGIKAFEAGELDAAADAFTKALSVVPDHPALNLNLIQVYLKQSEAEANQGDLVAKCRALIDRLETLPEQHRQYRRYTALKRKLEGMT
ncbi:Chemotaxis regulator - transmits chemoreceptor signals to flagelllar motor components CheY [Marinobacter nitratireducens]|uniref:Chemotaxis regulator-transmits chemoreceptor signals to flagelllar motor components CheY n=1 Tax=Marinobacter nitratireducens TaxID=1137280 RepID=A0A072N6C1_9GAMM|nr:tetratricopeptide repeat-containing response regulator [Marinobacter nitratireducens]KEF32807.1 Chemotaxis regulator - transmits chemoreceptor signals to flagelllar motor components CheY [Marinobacter nitratireducens]